MNERPGRGDGPRPPRWAEWIFERLLPAELRASIRDDLRERFAAILGKRGARVAGRWYWIQLLSTLRPDRFWGLRRTSRRADGAWSAGTGWLRDTATDVRHALRRLRKAPGAALATVTILGIGIGGGTGIYGIHEAFQDLRTAGLPDPDAVRFVVIRDSTGRMRTELPPELAGDLLEAASPTPASLIVSRQRLLRAGGAVDLVPTGSVTPGHFDVVGVRPALGRSFTVLDEGTDVAVLSYAFWQSWLGGDPDVLGSVVHIDRRPHSVIGVTPAGFDGIGFFAAWTPLSRGSAEADAGAMTIAVGTGADEASAFDPVAGRLAGVWSGRRTETTPPGTLELAHIEELGSAGDRRSITTTFAVLGLLSLLVLLAASANAANLGVARVLSRRRELALRHSLGASRSRIVRLVVTEQLVLGMAAGLGAVAVVAGLSRLIPGWLPPSSADLVEFQVQLAHLQVAFGLAVAAGLASALLPALRTPGTGAVLRSGPGSVRGDGPGHSQDTLVTLQVATSILLLASAGLLARSTTNLRSLDQGIVPDRTSVFTAELPEHLFAPDDVAAFVREVVPRLASVAGVEAVGAATPAPVIGWAGVSVRRPGRQEGEPARRLAVYGDYFQAAGTELRSGRPPRPDAVDEVVVTADLAHRLWPEGGAVGRPVEVGNRRGRVVGVAEAGVYGSATLQPHVFTPLDPHGARTLTLLLRGTAGSGGGTDATVAFAEVRRAAAEVASDVPLTSLGTLGNLLDRAQVLQRAASGLTGILGLLALIIAVVGLYAHFSHYVASRRREIGVRLALGASRKAVLHGVLRRGLVLTGVGLVVGGLLTWIVGRLLQSFLFGVGPADPVVIGAAAGLLALASVAALLAPAHRAASVEPMGVLREDG